VADVEKIIDAHSRAVAAFAALLRPAPAAKHIPHLTWTIGELGTHVLCGLRDYERAATHGIDVWADISAGSAINAGRIASTHARDPAAVAAALPAAAAALHYAWRRAGREVRWSGGITVPTEVAAGINLGDVVVHGWDLARALGTRWPIEREMAVICLRAASVIAPNFVSPSARGFSGAYEIRLRGDGKLYFAFEDGALRTGEHPSRPVHCRLWADPASFLLTSYGRLPVWRVAATGKVLASGRKPWLAFKFKSLLLNP
jgi:uncharacterized protein (TIGR03083 family)